MSLYGRDKVGTSDVILIWDKQIWLPCGVAIKGCVTNVFWCWTSDWGSMTQNLHRPPFNSLLKVNHENWFIQEDWYDNVFLNSSVFAVWTQPVFNEATSSGKGWFRIQLIILAEDAVFNFIAPVTILPKSEKSEWAKDVSCSLNYFIVIWLNTSISHFVSPWWFQRYHLNQYKVLTLTPIHQIQ